MRTKTGLGEGEGSIFVIFLRTSFMDDPTDQYTMINYRYGLTPSGLLPLPWTALADKRGRRETRWFLSTASEKRRQTPSRNRSWKPLPSGNLLGEWRAFCPVCCWGWPRPGWTVGRPIQPEPPKTASAHWCPVHRGQHTDLSLRAEFNLLLLLLLLFLLLLRKRLKWQSHQRCWSSTGQAAVDELVYAFIQCRTAHNSRIATSHRHLRLFVTE